MTAYLVIVVDSDLKVSGVRVQSSDVLVAARRFLGGRFADTQATLYMSPEHSYEDGERDCWDFYEKHCDPVLVVRFPAQRGIDDEGCGRCTWRDDGRRRRSRRGEGSR